MPFQVNLDLSADRGTITVEFHTRRMRLSAEELDQLIGHLVRYRTGMLPGHDAVFPPPDGGRHGGAERWWVMPEENGRETRISMSHPGLGWLSVSVDEASARKMAAEIETTIRTNAEVRDQGKLTSP